MTRALRVGMFSPYSLTVPGGVQAQVLGLAAAIRRRGHEVRVLGPCDGPPPAPFVTPLGDSLPTAANGSIVPLAPDPSAVFRTIRALRDEDFDVWHLHEPFVPGPTLTALTLHSRPIVATFHAAGRSSSYRMLRPVLAPLLRRIDHAVAVSPDAAELVRGHLGGDFEVLFNGVVDQSPPAEETVVSERPSVLFIGRHEERKGLRVLLEAFDSVAGSPRVDDPICWIIGEGPETNRLRQQYSDPRRYRWLGRVSDAEKATRLRAATVLVAPALRGESFGIVLLEGMSAGAVVIASDIDGYRNVATNGQDSILVPAGNVEAVADALRSVLHDPELRDRLRAQGRRRAAEFSMDRLAEIYVERYRLVTGAISGVGEPT
ncbi:MAG: glycosyltransferase family 4 protein [Ilumatobacteraceae bacterium]|jgi:phosphatidylinositol alpha-mannosyltransferase